MSIFGGGGSSSVPSIKATAPRLSSAQIESSSRRNTDLLKGRSGVGGLSNILTPLQEFSRLGARFQAALGRLGK